MAEEATAATAEEARTEAAVAAEEPAIGGGGGDEREEEEVNSSSAQSDAGGQEDARGGDERSGADDAPLATAVAAGFSSSSSASSRRPVAFQPNHALKFGLQVVAREADTARVTAVLCLFCKHFGREPKAGAKRRATTNFKYFKGVFRTDQYLQHHRLQHPTKWRDYDAASVREKQTFFPRYVMAAEPLDADAAPQAKPVKKPRHARDTASSGEDRVAKRVAPPAEASSVKDAIVGELSKPSGFEIPTKLVALLLGESGKWEPRSLPSCVFVSGSLDKSNPESMVGSTASVGESGVGAAAYVGAVADRLSFDVAVDLCGSGLSPAQTVRVMDAMAKYVPNGAALAAVWEELVENYTQVATLGSLGMLSKLLSACWAFSIGFHSDPSSSSCDAVIVRVRLHATTKLCDFHLCWLRTDAVDGASSSLSKGATLTWNGNVLLGRALLRLFHQLQGGAFDKSFHALKGYIKSQSRLIQEIGHESQQQPHAAQRSRSDGETIHDIIVTTRWFTEKRVRIRKHLEEESESPPVRPSESWWLCLAIFDWIATPTDQVMNTIQLRLAGLAPAEQVVLIRDFVPEIASAFGVRETQTDEAATNVVQYRSSPDASFAVTKTGLLKFIVDLGSFVNSLLSSIHHDELDRVLDSLGSSIATFVETLRAGLDHAKEYLWLDEADGNGSDGSLASTPPPVLPHELAKLTGKDFSALVDQFRARLSGRFTDEELDTIDQEHQALKRAMREKDFRAWAADSPVDRLEQFDGAWLKTTGRFRSLHAFAGGLATCLPRDVRVASRVPSETTLPPFALSPSEPPAALMDMALEAPLHTAQFQQLHALVQTRSVLL